MGLKEGEESGREKRAREAREQARKNINDKRAGYQGKLDKMKDGKAKDKRTRMYADKIKRKEFQYNKKHGYDSVDEAAMAAFGYVSGAPYSERNEYGGRLYVDKDGRARFTAPTRSASNFAYAGHIPEGTKDAGLYHTHHGAIQNTTPSKFSPGDKQSVTDYGAISRIYMMNVETGIVKSYGKGRGEHTLKDRVKIPKVQVTLPYGWDYRKNLNPSRDDNRRRFYQNPGEGDWDTTTAGDNPQLPARDAMKQYQNNTIYDQSTGKIKEKHKHLN